MPETSEYNSEPSDARYIFANALGTVSGIIVGAVWWRLTNPDTFGWIFIEGIFAIPVGLLALAISFKAVGFLSHWAGITSRSLKIAAASLLPALLGWFVAAQGRLDRYHNGNPYGRSQSEWFWYIFGDTVRFGVVIFVGSLLGAVILFWPNLAATTFPSKRPPISGS